VKRRWPAYLLALFLFFWESQRVATELLTAFSSLPMRGPAAFVELAAHVIVAAIAVAAALSLWNGAPHAPALAIVAIVLSAATTVQSLYWSRLPRQTMPGDAPILAAVAILHAAVWTGYLTAARRSFR
jgi:hypothetical protein